MGQSHFCWNSRSKKLNAESKTPHLPGSLLVSLYSSIV